MFTLRNLKNKNTNISMHDLTAWTNNGLYYFKKQYLHLE
jgi:hypothetical protein